MKLIQDNKGKNSSIRVIALIIVSITGMLMLEFGVILWNEHLRPEPDYGGLAKVLGTLFTVNVLIVSLKAWQKKLER